MSEQLQKFYPNPLAAIKTFDLNQRHSAELPAGLLPEFSPFRYILT